MERRALHVTSVVIGDAAHFDTVKGNAVLLVKGNGKGKLAETSSGSHPDRAKGPPYCNRVDTRCGTSTLCSACISWTALHLWEAREREREPSCLQGIALVRLRLLLGRDLQTEVDVGHRLVDR